jgi:hypothetical protein
VHLSSFHSLSEPNRIFCLNTAQVNNSQDWSKTIQPLDMGTYDTSKFIEALQSINYKGPIILHTFALDKVAADHHQRSFKKYQELFSK